jgi:hypothetical protein
VVLFSLGLGLAERHKRMAASHTGMPIFWKSELAPDQDLPADEHAPTGQLGALDGEDGLISNNTCLPPYSVWRWDSTARQDGPRSRTHGPPPSIPPQAIRAVRLSLRAWGLRVRRGAADTSCRAPRLVLLGLDLRDVKIMLIFVFWRRGESNSVSAPSIPRGGSGCARVGVLQTACSPTSPIPRKTGQQHVLCTHWVVPAERGRATQLGGIWHGSQESQSGNPAGRTAPPVGIEGIEPSLDRDPRPRKRYAASPGLHNRRAASGDRTVEVRVSTEAAWPGSQCRLPGLALA